VTPAEESTRPREPTATAGPLDRPVVIDLETVPDQPPLIITIDGPAGTGKSTVSRLLAGRLGLDFLDTGAMYRAATAIAIDAGLDDAVRRGDGHATLLERVVDADLHFDWQTDPPSILAWLRPMNDRIRKPDVTALVSRVSAIGTLRRHMVQKQRIIGFQHPRLVTEGRDQGTVAFPDAPLKFYLNADPAVRAERRAAQYREQGHNADAAQVLEEILERDRIDSTRSDGPLRCPDDAVTVDTSDLDVEGVLDVLERESRERLGARLEEAG